MAEIHWGEAGAPPRGVAVATTSTLVSTPRDRKKIVLTNDSDEDIYLARADSAVMNAGLRLNADGGSIVDEPDNTGYMYAGPWYAICSSGAKNLCVSEDF